MDDEERSRIEKEDNNTLIIVDIPTVRHDEEGNSIYDTIPIGMIVMPDCFVTICLEEESILNVLLINVLKNFIRLRRRALHFSSYIRFLLII